MRRLNRRLTTIVPMIIVAILLTAFGALTIINNRTSNTNLRNAGREVSRPTTVTTAKLLFNPVYTLNITEVHNILNQFVDGTTIVYAVVYDRQGTKLAEVTGKWVPGNNLSAAINQSTVGANQAQEQAVDQYLLIGTPISVGTEVIGSVIYGFDQGALQADLGQTQLILTFAIVIALLATSIIVYLFTQSALSPLVKLSETANRIGQGELSSQVEIEGYAEISSLAASLEDMRSALQKSYAELENRVAERTADLEWARLVSEGRAQELQAISEISRTISSEQRLEILLPLVTRLVSERFGFYHGAIFFVDDTRQFAVLQAANSEGGQRMLARGHRLELGIGIVGTVAQLGTPRLALDVGSDAVFFDNPDLPETRSEMALPLNFRGQTIGVLDVQSIKPNAFMESDVNTLSILADQIAIAIQNARLFGETQQAREEAENLYNRFLRTEWKSFLQQYVKVGYRQTSAGGQALQKPIKNEEILQALRDGQLVVLEGNMDRKRPSIAVPVKLRGQTLGVINITSSKNRGWNQDEINLAQAISDRLALALDNARLLQESQRRAAKEAKIGEVTAKIGASINMRNVLQTAVEELGRALPGSEIVIQFQNSQEN